jgi:hypothetical protein
VPSLWPPENWDDRRARRGVFPVTGHRIFGSALFARKTGIYYKLDRTNRNAKGLVRRGWRGKHGKKNSTVQRTRVAAFSHKTTKRGLPCIRTFGSAPPSLRRSCIALRLRAVPPAGRYDTRLNAYNMTG